MLLLERPHRRSSSVVERTLGKGKVGSSILPCGTIPPIYPQTASRVVLSVPTNARLRRGEVGMAWREGPPAAGAQERSRGWAAVPRLRSVAPYGDDAMGLGGMACRHVARQRIDLTDMGIGADDARARSGFDQTRAMAARQAGP